MRFKWPKRIENNWLGLRVGALFTIAALLVGSLLGLCLFPHLPIRLAKATPTPSPIQPTATLEALEFPTPTVEGETITPTPLAETPTPSLETPTPSPAGGPTPTPTPTSVTYPPVPGTGFDYGIQIDPFSGNLGGLMGQIGDLRFRWVRLQVRWYWIEPSKGQFSWVTDDWVRATNAAGIKVLFSVLGSPAWATIGPSTEGPPANNNDFGDFMAAMAARYSGNPGSVGRVDAYEIWNEQNLSREWSSPRGLRADDYVALLRVAYNRIKAVDPSIIVVAGAPTPVGWTGPDNVDDFAYLRQMYQAGLKNYCDAVGVHPSGFANPPDMRYTGGDPDPDRSHDDNRQFYFLNTIEGYHNIMAQFGDGGKKLWATEFGWASVDGLGVSPVPGYEYAADNTEAEQADYIVRAYQIGRQKGYMGVMLLWNLNFGVTSGASDEKAAFGILRPDGTLRPAYQALKNARLDGTLP